LVDPGRDAHCAAGDDVADGVGDVAIGRRVVKKTASPADYRLGEEAAHREFDFV
jgi:hypothetical protein